LESRNINYISKLDHLRFFAAFLVLLYHNYSSTHGWYRGQNPLISLISEGNTGVALFMVISGFLFTQIMYGQEIDYKKFLLNRVLRIYPLYLFVILLAAYIDPRNNLISVFTALFGLNRVTGTTVDPLFISQMWSVAVEFQFYIILPFLMGNTKQRGLRFIFYLLIFMFIIRSILFIYYSEVRELSYWTIFGRIDQFCIGILFGVLYKKEHIKRFMSKRSKWMLAFILSTLVVLLGIHFFSQFGGYDNRYSAIWIFWPSIEGLMWILFVVSYLSLEVNLNKNIDKALSYLGTISYSIYVFHVSSNFVSSRVISYFNLKYSYILSTAISTCLIICIASLSYLIIEKTFLDLRTRYIIKK